MLAATVLLALPVVAAPSQELPRIALETYPAVSRQPIAEALAAARAHPADPAAVGRLAMVLHAWDQLETAAPVYSRARALERRFDWYYLGGLVEARLGRHAAAAQLLTEAVKLSPDSVPARLALADAQYESGHIEAAAAAYSSLTTGASAPHAHYGLGRCRVRQEQKEAALQEFDRALQLFPEFGPAHYARGMVLRGLGRTADAQEALTRSQQLGATWPGVADPTLARVRAVRRDAGTHVERGLALQKQGDIAGAIAEYEAAVSTEPTLAAAHVNLIALYGRAQDWDKAGEHFRALEQSGPVPAEAHFNYGICLAAQRRTTDAAAQFQEAVAINPHHAGALSSLGQLAEMEGRLDEAEASYRKAAAAAPQDPSIRFNIGRMLLARKEYDAAIAEFETLRAVVHPDRARFLFGLATAQVLAGQVAEGRRAAIEARDLARESGQRELADAIDGELAKLPQE